jgi:5-methylcytosine-specific restriction protein A
MPTAPPKACHCGGIRINGVCSRCKPMRRESDRQRGHAAARGYDYQWQKFRLYYLAMHPLCMDCEGQGLVAAAEHVHHVEKLSERPDLKYEEANLMPLCERHHNVRTARGE